MSNDTTDEGKSTLDKLHEDYRSIPTGDFKCSPLMYAYIEDVLDKGIISYGKYSKRFEKEFSETHGSKYGILSNSGTSALHVALQAMKELYKWDDFDEVIVPATTFVATPNIVYHVGMKPRFVDVDPRTFNIDIEKIEQEITDRTRAIIPVHLFGQMANMREIMEIANVYGLSVISDSCECMFAHHHGRKIGQYGDIACFSMYMAHIVTAGVGGISITNDKRLAARMRSLVNHGLDIEQLNPDDNFSPRAMPNRRFEFTSRGHSFRITELEAALACAQLDNYRWDIVNPRRRNANHLTAGLKIQNDIYRNDIGRDIFSIWKWEDGNEVVPMMYPIVFAEKPNGDFVDKEPLMEFLNKRGIETRDMLPLINQPVYKDIALTIESKFRVSRWIIESGFYVGCHHHLTPEDMQFIASSIGRWLDINKENLQ